MQSTVQYPVRFPADPVIFPADKFLGTEDYGKYKQTMGTEKINHV
jgi:hypothetical protein